MFAVRSRLFACLALFLWASSGLLASDACVCPEESSCEHAGKACTRPDDCSDCVSPASAVALADEPLALADLVKVSARKPFQPEFHVYSVRRISSCAAETFRLSASDVLRPPALRAGTMCLRV